MSEQRAVGVARRFIGAMLGWHVTDAVLAPGSRSGPLALALAAADEQGLIRLHVRVDEREAGFLALGLAKASGRLVPVITTSGTAVANLHPAMLEAVHADVPVLAVTADRPARLRGTGANQTTDQREIFPGLPFVDRVKAINGGPGHLNLEPRGAVDRADRLGLPEHHVDGACLAGDTAGDAGARPPHRRRRRRRRPAAGPHPGPGRRVAAAGRAHVRVAQRRGAGVVPPGAGPLAPGRADRAGRRLRPRDVDPAGDSAAGAY
ncbi:thiamine pyrophosphate-binding protein [Aeromicrobium sp. UC242_57]|uniref:thiamine pyrophosphate-binding protein n=1 Tax=Aeromicrobium sp. UC242_57 TaxID=3374624 RepID=UPI0037AEEB07